MRFKTVFILCLSAFTISMAGCADNTNKNAQIQPAATIASDTQPDSILEEHPDLSKSKFQELAITYYNLSETEANAMYQKIEDSKILQNETIKITGIALNDYDANGETDMLVCLYEDKEYGDSYTDGCLYLFMNDDAPYYIYDDFCCYSFGAIFGDFGADIDHDGNTEIVFCVQGTGCGGAGDSQKFVLKYKDNKIIRMELPTDFTDEDSDYDVGLFVNVERDNENNVYRISCPYLDDTILMEIAEDDEDWGGGANCRGYYALTLLEQDGKQYLAGHEYLYAGGIADGVGNAVFLFDWDEDGNVFVKDWYVEDFDGNRYFSEGVHWLSEAENDTSVTNLFDEMETGEEVTAYKEFLTGKRVAIVSDKMYTNGGGIMDTTLDKTENGFLINDLITVITNEVVHTSKAEASIKSMEYALIDCGNDGKKQLVLRANGMGFYAEGDDSDLTMVFDCNGEELSMIYSVASWARSNTVLFKNGYVLGDGSGGAASHYMWEGIIKADGTYCKSYDCRTETGSQLYGMSSPWEVWEEKNNRGFPVEFHEYQINDDTVYSYYIFDEVTDTEKKIIMDYIKDNEARLGIRFLTSDEAWARVEKKRKALGITDEMSAEENWIAWQTLSFVQ